MYPCILLVSKVEAHLSNRSSSDHFPKLWIDLILVKFSEETFVNICSLRGKITELTRWHIDEELDSLDS